MTETPTHYIITDGENRIQDKASAAVMSDGSYEADYEAYILNSLCLHYGLLTSTIKSSSVLFSLLHLILVIFSNLSFEISLYCSVFPNMVILY